MRATPSPVCCRPDSSRPDHVGAALPNLHTVSSIQCPPTRSQPGAAPVADDGSFGARERDVDPFYLVGGLGSLPWHGTADAPAHLAADVAGIFVLAATYGAIFGWLARIARHRAKIWLPLAAIGGLLTGVLGEIIVAVAFAVAVFVAIPTRPLTPEEDAAVEPMPGIVGKSWYVRGRAYWGMRIVAVATFGGGVLLGAAIWVGVAQAIATPPDRGLDDLLRPPYDPLLPFKLVGLVVVWINVNLISAVWMWTSLNATDRRLLALPTHEPLPWPRFRLHYNMRPLFILLLPLASGAFLVVLFEYCRREIPTERLLRARAQRRLRANRS